MIPQEFRSAPGPNAGSLDAEYEAFQAGQLPPFHEVTREPHFDHAFPVPGASQSYTPSHSGAPGWALDFQNMTLHDVHSSPAPAHHPQQFPPPQSAQTTGWQQGFMRQSNANTSLKRPMTYGPDPGEPSFRNLRYRGGPQPAMQQSGLDQQTTYQSQSQDALDNALFEQYFEAAANEAPRNTALADYEMQLNLLKQENKRRLLRARHGSEIDTPSAIDSETSAAAASEVSRPPTTLDDRAMQSWLLEQQRQKKERLLRARQEQDSINAPSAIDGKTSAMPSQQTPAMAPRQDQTFDPASLLGPSIQREQLPTGSIIDGSPLDPIGSDLILAEAEKRSEDKGKQVEGPSDEADELARTAGSLLENVQHDNSQKFKQSNFLNLMRQLRDREVRVEGDKLVDVSKTPSP